MIITCPSCDAQYTLPDDAIGPKGRKVKCTTCGYTWSQAPAGEEDNASFIQHQITENFDAPSPVAEKITRVSAPVPVVKDKTPVTVALFAVAVAVVLLIVTSVFLVPTRKAMVGTWPPLALLYQAVGLSVPAPGFDLVLEKVETKITDGKLELKGTIRNPSKHDQALPDLLVQANGDKGALKDWPLALNGKILQVDKDVSFSYTLPDAPAETQTVTLRFTE